MHQESNLVSSHTSVVQRAGSCSDCLDDELSNLAYLDADAR